MIYTIERVVNILKHVIDFSVYATVNHVRIFGRPKYTVSWM